MRLISRWDIFPRLVHLSQGSSHSWHRAHLYCFVFIYWWYTQPWISLKDLSNIYYASVQIILKKSRSRVIQRRTGTDLIVLLEGTMRDLYRSFVVIWLIEIWESLPKGVAACFGKDYGTLADSDTGCSGKIVLFFTIQCNPSLAYIAVRDLQSSQCECTVTPIGW